MPVRKTEIYDCCTRRMLCSISYMARVMLINEQYTELIGSAEYFLETASFYPNMLGVIYTYIYLAAANLKIHRAEEAQENLSKGDGYCNAGWAPDAFCGKWRLY